MESSEPQKLSATLQKFQLPPASAKNRQRNDREAKAKRAAELWAALADKIGRRYADCTFENFLRYGTYMEIDRQNLAVEELRKYAAGIKANCERGTGVVLFGPVGTGKDHLMVALMRAACQAGIAVDWTNGMTIFGLMRDRMDQSKPEQQLLGEYATPGVLVISDPTPPWGKLTEYQTSFLFRLIDQRYRQCKPTWVTANFSSGEDAAARVSAPIIDRLKHGSLSIHCEWNSYRKSL